MAEARTGGQVHLRQEGAVAVITLDNPPVNSSTDAVRRGILAALGRIDVQRTTAVVLTGAGQHLVAGADLHELENEPTEPTLPQVTAALAGFPLPLIAVVKGHTLGGGLELALACDVRLATPTAMLGLPEVSVGVIPGAGGTQRLPRAVGLPKALEMIVSGKPIAAAEANRIGLVDELLTASEEGAALQAEILAYANRYRGGKRPLAERDVAPVEEASLQAQAQRLLARSRGLPAAAVAAEVVMSAAKSSFAEAVAKERAHFLALRGSEPARALRYLFFAEREPPFTPTRAVAPRSLERVSVIGAGTMGSGIALCVLQVGYTVDLLERSAAALEAGVKRIAQELEGDVERGRMTAERRDELLARLRPTQEIQAVVGTDLVIEAIVEDLDIKRALFADLAGLVGEDTLLATNTSYLDIDRIAECIANPARVLGLHFFSPAQRMALLEVVRCKTTSEQTLSTAIQFSRRLKKKAIVVANSWGFVGNRLYAAYRRQCEFMLEEGASPERIDAALEAYGFAMGPFKVADMSGLDIAWRMRQQTMATRQLRRYVGIPDLICEAGRLGRKTGKGYYRYGEDKRPVADPEVAAIIDLYRQEQGIEARAFADEEIQQRALLALINEALLLLDEGVCQRPADIDIALVHGYGFPRWRGGPLFIARQMGHERLLAALEWLAEVSGKGHERGDASLVGCRYSPFV
ncbi:3-hydroxyacyl-CoA dehydrogenase NAD-binding domain-containing protein [Halomonas sp. MCCC 1A11057]|jgi:3-hydroxyacyl-CoA dehydrogenase|uniref:3-hydroxyacyl-CoA dehydrogenase NAD-binding domain-containing protein n=1 Tax=Halomonas sp. MCCC 1A11057 TaxID=2733482 RepID=UPI001F1810BC|nr:3-hydroxyacyl-CoA dehydrogenase NAD-binding domain-containing protein [Halomonas sp. MCCC 1A11057]MCE8035503.1 3-hydroxyacyl-CoA dehydrogenase [Halomonas sp. MCCC 1A11057]